MNPHEAADYALSLARKSNLPDVDVLTSRSESLSIRILRGQVEKVDQSNSLGLGIRVVQGGRTGLAFTERMEPESIERTLATARENAALQNAATPFSTKPLNPTA